MFNYLVRRLLYAPLIILGVMFVTFLIFFVVQSPDAMARNILGQRATPKTNDDWLQRRGYDKPLFLNLNPGQPSAADSPAASTGVF
nr:ABC transporter permease [Verrucomicrobiota bacterium]